MERPQDFRCPSTPEPLTYDPESGMWFGEPISFPPEEVERIKRETTPPNMLRRLVRDRSRELARNRDAYARCLLEDRLPRPLRWTINRPRALKTLLRVVPHWQPAMTTVYFQRMNVVGGMDEGEARQERDAWVAEHRPSLRPDDGLIFTYTDPSGLPAEVYGVE